MRIRIGVGTLERDARRALAGPVVLTTGELSQITTRASHAGQCGLIKKHKDPPNHREGFLAAASL